MGSIPSSDRVPVAAAVAAVGPLLVPLAAAVWLLVGWIAGADPFWPIPELNVAEAAAVRDHAEVVRLVESGQDPNRRWTVRPGLIDSRGREMTPLEAAVEIRRLELVQLLVRHGATMTPDSRAALAARAEALRADDIIAYLNQPAF